jgi:phosphate transport system substrate-binding protein
MELIGSKKYLCTVLLFLCSFFLIGNHRSVVFSQPFPKNIDPAIQPYQSVSGEVAGSLKYIGSDTMNNLVALWAEGFKKFYPAVREGIEGKGSASAPPALTEGTSTFGPMSRPWKAHEIDSFKDSFGYAPTVIPTAIDMLAVYVHKDNPTAVLSLQQLDAIFSKNRNGGMKKAIVTWGQLGLTGVWQDKPIRLYGRNSASGTYGFFKEHALFRGDFKSNVIEQPGSSSVVQSIANDRYGIGYSGIGYKTADVRSLPLSTTPDSKSITTDAENAYSGEYPLVHFLYLSVNHKPGSTLEPLRKEFLKYVLSATGQADVLKAGYLPVSYKTSQRSLGTITAFEVK